MPHTMETMDAFAKEEFVSIWVRDPRVKKDDFWHTHLDYEIALHTNSMCFRRKTSCVRRRYREFVWLRQRLQNNALLVELPKLPQRDPFFNRTNSCHVDQRMKTLRRFLEAILQVPLLLSDSCLHLFLQSQLPMSKMEACACGRTRYTVAQAIQRHALKSSRFPSEEELHTDCRTSCDSDCDSSSSSGPGLDSNPGSPQKGRTTSDSSPATQLPNSRNIFSCLTLSSDTEF